MLPQHGSRQRGNQPPQATWNIYQFESSAGPWVPIQSGLTNTQPGSSLAVFNNPAAYEFHDYRSVGLPSECGTIPGDSGYGSSRTTYSIIETSSSIHDDDASERFADQHVSQLINDLQVNNDNLAFTSNSAQIPRLQKSQHYCSDCKTYLKTRSEFKKHTQRHVKPFKCHYDQCPRVQGFSTPNDLARHKKTVHGELQGNGPIYKCRHEPCTTKKPKTWPRADNFRSHLFRAHSIKLKADDDLKCYLHQPAPPEAHDLQGVGSKLAEIDADARPRQLQDSPGLRNDRTFDHSLPECNGTSHIQREFPQHMNPPDDFLTSGDDETQYIKPDVLSGITDASASVSMPLDHANHILAIENMHQDIDASLAANESPIDLEDEVMEDAEGEDECETMTQTQQQRDFADSPETDTDECQNQPSDIYVSESPPTSNSSSQTPPTDSLHIAISALHHGNPELLEVLKSLPRNILETALNGEAKEGNGRVMLNCTQCSKKFARQCELKKHMKRHEKPYGCTYRRCTKYFGSKNDWKRHETSQHFLLETWNCDFPECPMVYSRRDMLKSHLQQTHKLENGPLLEERLEGCRLGRHCDLRFWCGFCVETKEIEEPGGNSWTKRCDHIDNHLFGKGGLEQKPMSEWRYLEDEVEKGESTPSGGNALASTCNNKPPSATEPSQKGSSKRKRETQSKIQDIMWECCHCSQYMNYTTSSRCIECHHEKCANCRLERVSSHEDLEPAQKRDKTS